MTGPARTQALAALLPARPPLGDIDVENSEEVSMADIDMDQEMRRQRDRQMEEEDDDEPQRRVQCAQQSGGASGGCGGRGQTLVDRSHARWCLAVGASAAGG